jgi:hypothetical protein
LLRVRKITAAMQGRSPTAIDLSQSHFADIGDKGDARAARKKEPPMIKTILVPATGNETDVATFAAALQVARSFAAHLDFLHVRLDTVEVAVAMAADIGGGGSVPPG